MKAAGMGPARVEGGAMAKQEPIKLESKTYWQLKSIELEGQVLKRQMSDTWSRYEARRQAAYEAAKLDAAAAYVLDDKAETFTPDAPPAPAPAPAAAKKAAVRRVK